jgi:glycosyltransferase involved in cell wall biosynthesis
MHKDIVNLKKISDFKLNLYTIPKVSISCITFNQVRYIRQTLDGFLMQLTDFPVEILIHDDASTDGTAEIIEEYYFKYPNIIKPILRKENQYSKVGFKFAFDELKRAKGDFVAICEGDDYWSDDKKLYKQVVQLQNNNNLSVSFHSVDYYYELQQKMELHRPKYIPVDFKYTIEDLIKYDSEFISNCSVMFLSKFGKNFPTWVTDAPIGDLPLCLYLATQGDIGYINESMSVYRVNSLGSWTSNMSVNKLKRIQHLINLRKMWISFNKITNYKFQNQIEIKTRKLTRSIINLKLSNYFLFRIASKFYKQLFNK